MNNIEIEIQVKIEKDKNLKEFLKKNASFRKEVHQADEYFSPNNENYLESRPIKKWLRLRSSNEVFSITYKNYYFDKNGKSTYCDEYETKIESIENFRKIFKALNFKSLIIVDKIRKTWNYKDYEILIDSVKNLGDFVEIEYIGKKQNVNPEKITKEMMAFLKSIDCGTIERNYVGYPFQLLFPEEIRFEIF